MARENYVDLFGLYVCWRHEISYMIDKILHGKKVVLASASPRRKYLLEMLGLAPLIVPAQVHEPITKEQPYIQVMKHARNKAQTVAAVMDAKSLVIGADTIVVVDKLILGKPATKEEARQYLRMLSGRTHRVYTGICLCWQEQCHCAYERSLVEFELLTAVEIEDYIATHEPLDKAGAYGIQGFGSQFIRKINGCYFNVMGFPIHLFYKMLQDMHREDTLI